MGCLFNLVYGFTVRVLLGRLLSMRPRVRSDRGTLVASTSPHIAVLTLGLKRRTVILDPCQRAVRILSRYAWLFPVVRRIPFEAVREVVYGYGDLNPLQGFPLVVYQELDMFTVRLALTTGERLLLCRFFGHGDLVNNSWWPDWMLWDEQICAELAKGSQETESRAYAEAVARTVGVPLRRD